jgi:thiol-disulfide isomerase/thioredoxin
MSYPIRSFLSLAALVAALLAPAASAGAEGPLRNGAMANFTPIDPPRPAPVVGFAAADGSAVSLDSFRGRVVLLNLWATWCGPCVDEMPSLDRLQAKLGGGDFAVVAVSQDFGGLPTVTPFYKRHGIAALAVYTDSRNEVAHKLGIQGLPTTMIIGRDGRAVGALVGAAAWDSPEAIALVRYYIDAAGGKATPPAAPAAPDANVIKASGP